MSKPLAPISQLERAQRWFLLATQPSIAKARRAYTRALAHCQALWQHPDLTPDLQIQLLEVLQQAALNIHTELQQEAYAYLMGCYQRLESGEQGPLIHILRAQYLSLYAHQLTDFQERLQLLQTAEHDFLQALASGDDPLLNLALAFSQWSQVPLLESAEQAHAILRITERLLDIFARLPYRLMMTAPLQQLLDDLTQLLPPEQAVELLLAVHKNQLLAHHPEHIPSYNRRFCLLEQPLVQRLSAESAPYQQLITGFVRQSQDLSPFVIWREPRLTEWLLLFETFVSQFYDHPRYLAALVRFEHYLLALLYLPERPRDPVWAQWAQALNDLLPLVSFEQRLAYLTSMATKMQGLLHDQLIDAETFQSGWIKLLWFHLFSSMWESEYISAILDILLQAYQAVFTPEEELHPCLTCEHPLIFQILAAAKGPAYTLLFDFIQRWYQMVVELHYCNWNLKGWGMLLHDLALNRGVEEARELLELACTKYEEARELDEEDAELFTLWSECLQDRAACYSEEEGDTFRIQADEKYRRALELIYRAS